MSDQFKILEVVCPTCGNAKNINVPAAVFAQKKFGTIKIQVPINAVCPEHQFIVFVDTKGIIRGYDKIDLQVAAVTSEIATDVDRSLNLRKLIQIFGIYGILSLIHSKIFNYPVYIIKDKQFEYSEETLNFIGDMILPENFSGDQTIYLLDEPDINNLKIKDKDAFVMDTQQHIYQTPWKEKLKFEKQILRRVLDIIDENEQLKLLQQEISNLFKEEEYTLTILNDVKEISASELIRQISKSLNIPSIKSYRVSLIKELIKRRNSPAQANKIKTRFGKLGSKFNRL
ncbi:hypothetical protein LCGC14_0500770 [marine sediment metagenome]|uniref:Uncharacterized protein n=1 Tax=marine sediment metagenome TaxID=412755 RepID=A0A0F9VCL2_9ZZZZ|nr:MAG: hypothetical protein Lokiarch_50000 [Candidatus Lokiarchaeum sp. GC14_75]